MIAITKSHNRFADLLKNSISDSKLADINDLESEKNVTKIIFFQDAYLDNASDYLKNIQTVIKYCEKNKTPLLYIDSVHLYGLTEKTSVSETDLHEPQSRLGKMRKEAYDLVKNSNITYMILRFPDFLGKGCNYFFNELFDKQSNFIKWPGLTHINHEFLYIEDALKSVQASMDSDFTNQEFNVSGSKYTLEQIEATVDMLTGIVVKETHLSGFLYWMKSKNDNLVKDILENDYLFRKPVFLNGNAFDQKYNIDKENDLNTIIHKIMNID